jgi:hypothetical protein
VVIEYVKYMRDPEPNKSTVFLKVLLLNFSLARNSSPEPFEMCILVRIATKRISKGPQNLLVQKNVDWLAERPIRKEPSNFHSRQGFPVLIFRRAYPLTHFLSATINLGPSGDPLTARSPITPQPAQQK